MADSLLSRQLGAYRLASGVVLDDVTLAYRTLGRLNDAGTNAVLVLHGYTTGPSMLDPGANVAEGSWSALVGPGRAIDTDTHFVICPNMLGSCYGSTGPASIAPGTSQPYGAGFPRITVGDIVGTQKLLLDALGVRRLAAVTGPSFGGYQALQWAVDFPWMVERVVSAVAAPFNPASAVRAASVQAWLAGIPPSRAAMVDALTASRADTLRKYGVDAQLQATFPIDAERAAEIGRLAHDWASGFEAGSLLSLAYAAEGFDVRPRLKQIAAPVLVVMSRTDAVFSPQLASEFGPLLTDAGIDWTYVELDSDNGHFASGADAHLWRDALRAFMLAPSSLPDSTLMAHLQQTLPGMPPQDLVPFARSLTLAEPYALGPDALPQDGVPRGALRSGVCAPGAIYPGVAHDYTVYVPARYDGATPAALMVCLDGARYLGPEISVPTVLDNLIHAGVIPPTVAVFIEPGAEGPGLPVYGGPGNRSVEYDSLGDAYARFLLDELLPAATGQLAISADPAWRTICGLSSGGLCAFNVAWERPDAFGKVVTHCGSFVDIRGGHVMAAQVRRSPAKPLQVFLQTGAHDFDLLFGNWQRANGDMAAALAYRGYVHRLVTGTGGHSLKHGGAIFPATLRWLWQTLEKESA